MGSVNDKQARMHADNFMRMMHKREWSAVYLAKRRELEGDPTWTPHQSATRSQTMAAKFSEHNEDVRELIEMTVSMASAPVTRYYVAEMTRLTPKTTLRHLEALEASGRLSRVRQAEHPYAWLWSAPEAS